MNSLLHAITLEPHNMPPAPIMLYQGSGMPNHDHVFRSEVIMSLYPQKSPVRIEVCSCGERRMTDAVKELLEDILHIAFGYGAKI